MAQQEQKKPNILFIMSDDIGWFNVSCYNHGIMGNRTPNIDRIAMEGAMFTDFYGQQSCTVSRRRERITARGFHVLERRREFAHCPHQGLEGCLPGAAQQRACRMAGAILADASPQAFPSALRPFERVEDSTLFYDK